MTSSAVDRHEVSREGPSVSGRLVLSVMVVAAFSPYVAGFRGDQLITYGFVALTLPLLVTRLSLRGPLLITVGAWVVTIAFASVKTLSPPAPPGGFALGSPLANLDNLLMPLVAILIVRVIVTDRNRDAILWQITGIVVFGMCLNALISLAQLQGLVTPNMLSGWWSGGGGQEETVAARALAMGRHTGIFGQPALAGVAYGVGLICAVYRLNRRPLLLACAVVLVCLGGALAVTKAFLLVGLPVAGWHLLRLRGGRRARVLMLLAAALIGISVAASLLRGWTGVDGLLRLVVGDSDRSMLQVWSGGRYGETATLDSVSTTVLANEPLTGYGLHGLNTATDAMWLQMFTLSGLVGLVCYLFITFGIIKGYRDRMSSGFEAERRFHAGLVAIIVLTGLGFPSYTGNRIAMVVWLLLAVLMSTASPHSDRLNRSDRKREVAAPNDVPGTT